MVVVGEFIAVIVVGAGLVGSGDHVPVPIAAIVAVPFTQALTSGPASGRLLTMTSTVSEQKPTVHT
jgi:hypothetical protein